MRTLFLHPDDSPLQGPWAKQRWDLIVDLGKSYAFSEERWSQLTHCRVVRTESFRQGLGDARAVREILAALHGILIDEEGIDWWKLISLHLAPEIFSILVLRRMVADVEPQGELWATRRGTALQIVERILGCTIRSFSDGAHATVMGRMRHYTGLARRLSPSQVVEIFFDKYDSDYRWRSRFAGGTKKKERPVVLVPSAYGNVSRMAAAYARLLPGQEFLMVATRRSAKQFSPPANLEVRDLAAYATAQPAAETDLLIERWLKSRSELQGSPELSLLFATGGTDSVPSWIRDGLAARDAWRTVIENEPVCGVLCGDDSNFYTRLPVLLAAARNLPTVDFHHGAMDGRYVVKELPCDVYLAKNEMERDYLVRVCGLPGDRVMYAAPDSATKNVHSSPTGSAIILFSEPYEVAELRAEEVYREILPALCELSHKNSRKVIVKLHPFESRRQRLKIIRSILPPGDASCISVVDGPLNDELLAQAWFGITVESTTVIDCLKHGIGCFVCAWMSLSPYEYGRQYARFGIGEPLRNAGDLGGIPQRLDALAGRLPSANSLARLADPALLQSWLTSRTVSGVRSAS